MRSQIATLMVVTLGLVGAFACWLYWPAFRGWREINAGIRCIQSWDPSSRETIVHTFHADTFSNDCSSQTIKGLYLKAAASLAGRSGELKCYRWRDAWGWKRVSVVLPAKGGYIEVRASCNNDNDAVSIRIAPGAFEPSNAEVLSSLELPSGVYRCDWKSKS